jgi:hypothetical protein
MHHICYFELKNLQDGNGTAAGIVGARGVSLASTLGGIEGIFFADR